MPSSASNQAFSIEVPTVHGWHYGGLAYIGPIHHIVETDGIIQLFLDVPGILVEDLEVQIVGNTSVRISGERKKCTGSEFRFVRSFAVDTDKVDIASITTELEHGVLTLAMNKTSNSEMTRTIPVTTGNGKRMRTSVSFQAMGMD